MTEGYAIGTSVVAAIYLAFGILGVFMFGHKVQPSVLDSVGAECAAVGSQCPWEAYVLRLLFLTVLACHIPFVFFSGKEGVLIVIDEIDRRSISAALEYKLKKLAEKDAGKGQSAERPSSITKSGI